MARKSLEDNPAAEALAEIENFGDRIVEGISANPGPVIAVIATVLVAAAAVGGITQYRRSQADAASAAFAEVRDGYAEAMGASAGVVDIPEPANPETARTIRREFIERYAEVIEARSATGAATLAALAQGDLYLELGEGDAAIGVWSAAAAQTGDAEPIRALLFERIGASHEEAGNPLDAAKAYERAGGVSEHPLRYLALADAARCYADAGESQRAIGLYKRIQAESPETVLPKYLASRLRELEIRAFAEAESP